MGSRSYATEIVKLIDPEGKYFADRIISREDSGGPENRKQLKRIFPCDDRTVLIIDDRADVWEYSRNLVHVAPCTRSFLLDRCNFGQFTFSSVPVM